MFSLKRISRLRMVEILSVKMNYFKIFTVMFFMAFNALLPVDRCVISFFCGNPRFDFFVTTQALAVRQRFPDRMTLRAIFNSLEIAVSTGQIAGRYLRRSEHRRTCQQQKNSGTPVHFPVISC
jgi:ABC-type Fe3+ transport system permease subunit